MSRKERKYAVTRSNILVRSLTGEQRTALLGSVVKLETSKRSVDADGEAYVYVRFLDKAGSGFEETPYLCCDSDGEDSNTLIAVAEYLWPFLVAMASPLERVALAADGLLCDRLVTSTLHLHQHVHVFHNKAFHDALIQYIGPVEALGPGYFCGVQLMSRGQVVHADKQHGDSTLFLAIDKFRCVLGCLSAAASASRNPSRHEVDLIELIGGAWPGATDAPSKIVRNKSLNPISHLMASKKSFRASTAAANATSNACIPEPVVLEHWAAISENQQCKHSPEVVESHLTVGSLVEVVTDISEPLHGVIRAVAPHGLAGVELEEDGAQHLPLELTDGTHKGQRYFRCAEGRALFVPLSQCRRDARFDESASLPPTPTAATPAHSLPASKMFGQMDSPTVPGSVAPLSMPTEEDVLAVCGKYRGIQGHHNSCYLDATLFAMFTYTCVFDSLLFRPRTSNDILHYEQVQRVLREEIVNPLRQNLYVRADRVMKLRMLLEDLSSVSGLTSEEKDPEEFLNSLLAQILKAEPFLKLNSGQEAFYYQLFVEKDEGLALPSVQQLLEQSFLSSDIKLKEVPSCLIIQMPRFGKNFKTYPRILPSQLLDVTDIIENSPRQCTVCGKLAELECKACFGQCGVGLESTAFCTPCLETVHAHARRISHAARPLAVPPDFQIIAEHCPPARLYMELFAVVCIETSHYVAFAKCGSGHEAPWCFFDSMADRKGEQNGYNIPEMVACPDVSSWLSDDGAAARSLHDAHPHDKQLPEPARRLLCDAYICMYQSPDVMMYR